MPSMLHHRRRHSGFASAHLRPPVILLHVTAVTQAGAPNEAQWTFDRDVTDPAGPLVDLKINGFAPVHASRLAPCILSLIYPLAVAGKGWNCPADAAGIVSVDGYKLAAGSGTVG